MESKEGGGNPEMQRIVVISKPVRFISVFSGGKKFIGSPSTGQTDGAPRRGGRLGGDEQKTGVENFMARG